MPAGKLQRPPKVQDKTFQFRKFRGMNLTDARVAIDDDEFAWLENALTVGNGAVQLVPTVGSTLTTIGAGIARMFGFTLVLSGTATAVLITVNSDGSMTQVNAVTGATTSIGGAGTVSTSAFCTIWQASTILIIDPTHGYLSWNGATLTVIDATKTGVAVAVFEGRAWLMRSGSAGRTVEYTAPNTFNSFVAGDGAGSTIITDAAFPGNIITAASAFEQLWVVGQGAIEAIANVTSTGSSPSVVTTFSITNIVAGLGSNSVGSVTGYFRALTFMSPTGVYALSGVTPQKLSDKIDGIFPGLTLGDAPTAVATVQNLLVLCFLVTYTQATVPSLPTPASGASTATKLLLCFTQGKWFVATQGSLVWITTVIVSGVTQCWGTDGSTIYRVFGGSTSSDVSYKVQSKLYDFGLATSGKANTRFGFEYQAPANIDPTVTLDNESSSTTTTLSNGNTLTILNSAGATLTLKNNVNATLTIVASGMVLSRSVANMYGRYLGWTVTGSDAPYRMQAFQMRLSDAGDWLPALGIAASAT